MRLGKTGLIGVCMFLGLSFLSFQNCAKHQFSAIELPSSEKLGDGGPDGPGSLEHSDDPAPPVCTDFKGVAGALKVILVVDNTTASNVADPDKKFRQELLKNLVNENAQKANFSWTLIDFDDSSAHAAIGAGDDSPQFANAAGALAAIDQFQKSDTHGDSAAFKPALKLVQTAIKDDSDFQGDPAEVNYVVLFVSGLPPADFGDPVDLSALTGAVQDILALSPNHIALSAVHFGSKDGNAPAIGAEQALQKMAQAGTGEFTNFGNVTDPANRAANLDRFFLGAVARVPSAICRSTSPTATPTPAPTCPSASREIYGADETKEVACGTDGKKEVTSAVKITEECAVSNGVLVWTEISRTTIVKKEGACTGQSCRLPDGSFLPDKGSKTFYSSSSPQGSCADASQTRTCDNGVLSGSSTHTQTTCRNGCGSFGPDGTVKNGVVIGETSVPVNCPFGETGVTDTFESVVDQTCSDGKIIDSNKRDGKKTKAGVCPTYSWNATDAWGTCSADCGGQQSRVFECRDDKGVKADSQRCAGGMPTESRVCDGNPSAVAREESSTVQEKTGSTTESCPKNQIGVVLQIRDVTTKQTYACVDHKVAVAKTDVTNGPWTTERYCRDYVAHRCSQDSLSNGLAEGRYQWMLKCADQVPVIKKFLTEFKDVVVGGASIGNSSGRHLYPTFMNTATSPEKPWIAPTKESASCDVPSSVYVAAVCLSSCATPEQQIMAAAEAKAKLRYIPFVEALTQNAGFAATLQSNSTMSSKDVVKTKVQQWVTEMMDTDHDIVEFHTQSGQVLRLTTNHPVLADDGSMKLAGGFKVGDNLVRLGGEIDPIVSIDLMKYHGKVYNLFVQSAELHKNIVVTNGYLNGTAFFQNEGASNMNRKIFRKNLAKGVLSK